VYYTYIFFQITVMKIFLHYGNEIFFFFYNTEMFYDIENSFYCTA